MTRASRPLAAVAAALLMLALPACKTTQSSPSIPQPPSGGGASSPSGSAGTPGSSGPSTPAPSSPGGTTAGGAPGPQPSGPPSTGGEDGSGDGQAGGSRQATRVIGQDPNANGEGGNTDQVLLEDVDSADEEEIHVTDDGFGDQGGESEDIVLDEAIEAMRRASAQSGDQPGGDGSGGGGSEAEQLNRELDESLGRFDGTLQGERERIQARAEDTGDSAAQDESIALLDPDATAEESSGGNYGNVQEGGSGSATAGDSSSGSGMSPGGGTGRKGDYEHTAAANTVPPDIPDGSDDDVVARQIREAAMKERDPELREKLWDEYRKYVNAKRS